MRGKGKKNPGADARELRTKNPEGLLPWERFQKPPSYEGSHGGRAPKKTKTRSVSEPSDNRELRGLGRLVRIEYETDKGDGTSVYYHDFGSALPLLCYGSDDGKLYIVSGSYKVTSRGIVG